MDFAVNVVFAISQAFIMFSLGLGLEVTDLKRVFARRRAFAIGALSQIVLLPLVALSIVLLLDLPPVFGAGLMLLSFCPGGVSSNVIAKLSRGDLALSVSMTAVTSVIAFVTVLLFATWSILYLMGTAAPEISFFDISVFTFLVTTLPVMTGVLVRSVMRPLAERLERPLQNIAVVFWALLLVALIVASHKVALANMPALGLATMTLPLALPSALYSITMYLIVLPCMFYFRWRSSPEMPAPQTG